MTVQVHTINMVQDFTRTPFGRTHAQGRDNAEDFRTKLLVPALKRGGRVVVDLGGICGMSASFVQEAFGELIRDFSLADLKLRLTILADDDDSLVEQAWEEIRDAAAASSASHH